MNQLSRRNLTPTQSAYLRGLWYELEKGIQGGDHKSKGQNDPLINIAEKIANQTGVSEKTVKRNAQFAKAVDKLSPEEKAAVLAGTSGKTKMETPREMINSLARIGHGHFPKPKAEKRNRAERKNSSCPVSPSLALPRPALPRRA